MEGNKTHSTLCFLVIGIDEQDRSYLVLQQSQTNTHESADALWCYANRQMSVGEVVQGYLLPAKDVPDAQDKLFFPRQQANYLPTLVVE